MSRIKQIPSEPVKSLIESFLRTLDERNVGITPSFFDLICQITGISVKVLGTVYEQYRAENNENRKADGVYYTPQYIVDYIVEKTVGELVAGKTPRNVAKLKIVDPSCGSGSFLLGAYQFLIDWHQNYYIKEYAKQNRIPKGLKADTLTPDGKLTAAEKKRILLNNIFGVDIDVNAVEIAKFSLLLKCMEGETTASVENTQRLFHTKVLPSIDDNILVGNSLVDTDYYELPLEDDDAKKIKPFNWQRAFPQVFKQGGFDAVIGNPPYVMLQMLSTRNVFNYCLEHFIAAKYKIDTYQLFLERGIQLLTNGGKLGIITPNTYLKNIHAEQLRKLILAETVIKNIVVIQHNVFGAVSVDTSISIFEKGQATRRNRILVGKSYSLNNDKDVSYFEPKTVQHIRQYNFAENVRYDFNLFVSESDKAVLDKITTNTYRIGIFCDAYFGIQTFDREQYVTKTRRGKNYQPAIDGANIEPYHLKPAAEFVNFIPSAIKSGGDETVYRQERIGIRQIGYVPIATLVPADIFSLNTIYNVYRKAGSDINLKYFLGILNSGITKFYWRKTNSDEKKTFPKIKKEAILSIPLPYLDLANKQHKQLHDKIVRHVDRLLQLNGGKESAQTSHTKRQLETEIAHHENEINQIVYQLYGLTDEEIKIVECE